MTLRRKKGIDERTSGDYNFVKNRTSEAPGKDDRMEEKKAQNPETETRVRCLGNCFQTVDGAEKRCHAYGHHEWCQNYMVRLSLGKPEFFEEK